MYKCQICHKNSERYETQFNMITKIKRKIRGFDIEEEKKVCKECYKKYGK